MARGLAGLTLEAQLLRELGLSAAGRNDWIACPAPVVFTRSRTLVLGATPGATLRMDLIMATPKPHRDRTRGPAARAAARERRAQRVAHERLANAAERAFLAIVTNGGR